jgi:hypothetical protein
MYGHGKYICMKTFWVELVGVHLNISFWHLQRSIELFTLIKIGARNLVNCSGISPELLEG